MKTSLNEIQTVVIRAKEEARAAGILQEHLDAVAAVYAMRALSQDQQISTAPNTNGLTLTFAEWADQFEIDSHPNRFVVVGMYLRDHKQVPIVTSDDILAMYDKARWKKPTNPADVFGKSAQKRFFAPAEEQDGDNKLMQWQLTKTGYEYAQSLRKATNHE